MSIYHREEQYLRTLSDGEMTVAELSRRLYISEPTVRRDLLQLKEKGWVDWRRGRVTLKANAPDRRVPMAIRDIANADAKHVIAQKAAAHIKDGQVIMLDASTSARCLVPYLKEHKNIFVITSGAKTALALAQAGVRTLCIGGEMALESYSYIGPDAERTLSRYNADAAFFSTRGLSADGRVTDSSIMENNIRRIMIERARETYLLCDSSKVGQVYLNTLCTVDDVTAVIGE